ncbi:MAG: T9SS type A sorting domain-containing protein [bacterium]|nr:T9SS type A sorting domain-containing protein [bacterium]
MLLENGGGDVLYLRSDEPLAGGMFEPVIEITPPDIEFDSVEVGEDSVVAVRLENTGTGTLTIVAFGVTGTGFSGPPQWIVVNLEPGAFMTTEVRFTPLAEQSYLGRVLVWSNASSSPDTIRLSGRGWVFVGDATDAPLPRVLELKPLYPNPFNGAVNVSFSLPKTSEVSLRVYDVLGREVGSLINGMLNAGEHQVEWNCAECAAGVYLFKLNTAGQTLAQKAVYAK